MICQQPQHSQLGSLPHPWLRQGFTTVTRQLGELAVFHSPNAGTLPCVIINLGETKLQSCNILVLGFLVSVALADLVLAVWSLGWPWPQWLTVLYLKVLTSMLSGVRRGWLCHWACSACTLAVILVPQDPGVGRSLEPRSLELVWAAQQDLVFLKH